MLPIAFYDGEFSTQGGCQPGKLLPCGALGIVSSAGEEKGWPIQSRGARMLWGRGALQTWRLVSSPGLGVGGGLGGRSWGLLSGFQL